MEPRAGREVPVEVGLLDPVPKAPDAGERRVELLPGHDDRPLFELREQLHQRDREGPPLPVAERGDQPLQLDAEVVGDVVHAREARAAQTAQGRGRLGRSASGRCRRLPQLPRVEDAVAQSGTPVGQICPESRLTGGSPPDRFSLPSREPPDGLPIGGSPGKSSILGRVPGWRLLGLFGAKEGARGGSFRAAGPMQGRAPSDSSAPSGGFRLEELAVVQRPVRVSANRRSCSGRAGPEPTAASRRSRGRPLGHGPYAPPHLREPDVPPRRQRQGRADAPRPPLAGLHHADVHHDDRSDLPDVGFLDQILGGPQPSPDVAGATPEVGS